mmetsp:Transcript_23578/g.48047  ORF Transcript_23578/g.48047 Transcript_23578/m.48047 type:complete len:219 (+) Transcript_23578:206-862(+)
MGDPGTTAENPRIGGLGWFVTLAWSKTCSIRNIMNPSTTAGGRGTSGTTTSSTTRIAPCNPARGTATATTATTRPAAIPIVATQSALRNESLWWWSRFPSPRIGSFGASATRETAAAAMTPLQGGGPERPRRPLFHRCPTTPRANENESTTTFPSTTEKATWAMGMKTRRSKRRCLPRKARVAKTTTATTTTMDNTQCFGRSPALIPARSRGFPGDTF